MLKKLQHKFISLSAAGLFVLLLLIVLAINGSFMYQTNQQLNSRLSSMLQGRSDFFQRENHNFHLEFDRKQPPKKQEGFIPLMPKLEDQLRISPDGCLVLLSPDGTQIEQIHQDLSLRYTEEEVEEILTQLANRKKDKGWFRYYKYEFATITTTENDNQPVLCLINASGDLYSMVLVALISCLIGFLAFLFALIIIILASKKAVKPVAESYQKQKQFITDAGHELKTPLTVISANNELLRMIYGESEWFEGIDKQVAKMNHLVRSLIEMARMDEEQKPNFTSFSLSDAVFDTAKSFEGLLTSSGKQLTYDIEEAITYNGDEAKLRQVVSILMDNAVKYCDDQGKVSIKLHKAKQISLQVINDYADVEKCQLDRVFERFYRADKARTTDGSYGLGLSIAKAIIELHNGTIKAYPTTHQRVIFEVLLRPQSR